MLTKRELEEAASRAEHWPPDAADTWLFDNENWHVGSAYTAAAILKERPEALLYG